MKIKLHLLQKLSLAMLVMMLNVMLVFAQESVVVKTQGVATERAVTDFKAIQLKDGLNKPARKPIEFIGNRKAREIVEYAPSKNPAAIYVDPNVGVSKEAKTMMAGIPSPAPILNFNGLNDNSTSIPPDVNGAVGTTHIMTTLNSQVRIATREGVVVSTITLNSFFSSLSGVSGVYDPKVLFDHQENRWIFVASSNSQSAASSTLLAVSKTADPTGGWNFYRVDVDATNANWVDYPSLGFNDKWITVQMNLFTVAGNSGAAHQIYVWDKADVYAAGTGLYTKFNISNEGAAIVCPSIHYDNSVQNKMFILRVINGNSGGRGTLGLRTITGPVGSPVLSTETQIQTTSTWGANGNSNTNFAPQLGTTNLIATNDNRMRHVVVRNGRIWAAHSVFLPASSPRRSSVQWWELDTLGVVKQRERIDDPAGLKFYSFPSLAVNSQNDVLIGYASFSADKWASGSYSFRKNTDPINTMRDEYIFKYGENTYFKDFGGTRNRWGDYTNTVLDPLNDSVFWTIQEYAGNTINTWATWWAKVNPYVNVTDFTTSSTVVCPGNAVTFSDTSNFVGTNYSWTFTGGTPSTSNLPNPTVTYSATGRYRVSLTLDGITQTKDGYIIVASNPVRTILKSIANPCAGAEVTLTASQASGVYLWNTGETTRSIKVSTPGIYSCMITAPNGVCSRMSDSVNMVFNPLPTVTLDDFAAISPNASPLTLTGGLPTGGTYTGPGVSAGVFNPAVAGLGTHTIKYSYADSNGCASFAEKTIEVTNAVGLQLSSKIIDFSVTPNPSKGDVLLVFKGDKTNKLNVQVIDQLGRVVKTFSFENANNTFEKQLDLSTLKSGIYYIKADFGDASESRKLVIE